MLQRQVERFRRVSARLSKRHQQTTARLLGLAIGLGSGVALTMWLH